MNETGIIRNKDQAVGILVITHLSLAEEFVRTAELIVGKMNNFYPISVRADMSQEEIFAAIEKKIKEADTGKGVLILTDIFGGTPTNIALAFSGPRVDVICGVNLPMIIKAYSLSKTHDITEIARMVQDYGKKHIARANDILEPS